MNSSGQFPRALDVETGRRELAALIQENVVGIRDRIDSIRRRAERAGHPPVQRPDVPYDDRRWPWG